MNEMNSDDCEMISLLDWELIIESNMIGNPWNKVNELSFNKGGISETSII